MPNKFVEEEIRALCYKQRDTFDANGNPRTICHHIDFNHDNNDPENLTFVSASEHWHLHHPGFKKGQAPWNKGKKGVQPAWNKGMKLSAEYRQKISEGTKLGMKRWKERIASS